MKNIKNEFIKGLSRGTGVFIAIVGLGIITVFAANWYDSMTASVGEGLSITKWNLLVKSTVPTGAVMAFYGSNCPDSWTKADGSGDEKKVDGTIGNLDLRGEFVRGWIDTKTGVDDGRTLGSWQSGTEIPIPYGTNGTQIIDEIYNYDGSNTRNSSSIQPSITSWNGAVAWTYRTIRPRNVALLYCVKN